MNYSEFLIDTDKYPLHHPSHVDIYRMTEEDFSNGGSLFACHIPCDWGEFLVAATDKGICHMAIINNRVAAMADLQSKFPSFSILPMDESMRERVAEQILNTLQGKQPAGLKLHLHCSDFQYKIYESLLKIPIGYLATYTQIAKLAESPKAMRACGTAIGKNPVAILIPCHRVIPADGALGNYHYGSEIKRALVSIEIRRR